MIDKLIERLVESGPLGILCAVLLCALAVAARLIVVLFRLYAKCQEARIGEGKEAIQVANAMTAVIDALKDQIRDLQPSRRR